MSKKLQLPKLIVASSQNDADMLYAVGFFVPDPCIFLQQGKRSTVVLSDLEIDRGRKEAQVDEVVALSEISKRIPKGKDASFAGKSPRFSARAKCGAPRCRNRFRSVSPRRLPRRESGSSRNLGCSGSNVSSRIPRS